MIRKLISRFLGTRHESVRRRRGALHRRSSETLEDRLLLTNLDFLKAGDFSTGITTEITVHEPADFDGDGNLDVVALDITGNGIFLLEGDGSGQLGTSQFFAANPGGPTANPQSLGVADFDGDSNPDVVIGEFLLDHVTFFTNDGTGGFQSPTRVASNGHFTPRGIDIGDVNGDSVPDIALTYFDGRFHGGDFSVWTNPGATSFPETSRQHINAGGSISVKLGDFDGDSNLDAVVTTDQANIGVALGNGDGTFQSFNLISTGTLTNSTNLETGDFDQNGTLDVIVTDRNGPARFMLGDGNGSFTPGPFISTPQFNSSIRGTDFDGDGDTDFVANSFVRVNGEVVHGDDLYVLRNDGDLSNLVLAHTLVEPAVIDIRVADYNNDGLDDFSVSRVDGGLATYLKTSAVPTIDSFEATPDPVLQGADLTLTANGVADSDGTVASVNFYWDINANGTIDDGTDVPFGADTDGSDGWSVTSAVTGIPAGAQTFLAQAEDDTSLLSNVVSTSVQVDTAVYWDGDAGDLLWNSPLNWSSDALPGGADDVVINVPGDITVTLAGTNTTVNSLLSAESLTLASGSLKVSAASEVHGTFTTGTNTTLTANGVDAVFLVTGPTTLGVSSLLAYNGGVISLPNATTYSAATDGDTNLLADGNGSQLLLSGITSLRGVGRHGRVAIRSTNGGNIDLSGLIHIPSGTTEISAKDSGSIVDVSNLETWSDGNQFRHSSVTWGNGGVVHVGSLHTVISVGVIANTGDTLVLPALTAMRGGGDTSALVLADGANSRIEFPVLTTMDGTNRHGQTDIRARNGGIIDMSSVIDNIDGTTSISAFDAGSLIDLSSLQTWSDGNQFRHSSITWGLGGAVNVDSLHTISSVGIISNTGDTLIFPALTAMRGGGDTSALVSADGASSRIEFPVLTTMDGTNRHGATEIRARNGGVIDMSSVVDNINGTTRISALDPGSLIDLSSLEYWIDGNQFGSSSLTWGDGGTVNVDSLQTTINVSLLASGGNVLTFPAMERIGGTTDSASLIRADGAGSRLEFPAVTVADGTRRHGDVAFRAQNGGVVNLPALLAITTGAVNVSAVDTDGAGNGSLVNMPLLQTWTHGNIFRGSSLTVDRDGIVNFGSLAAQTDITGIYVAAAGQGQLDGGLLQLLTGTRLIGDGTVAANVVNTSGRVQVGNSVGVLTIDGDFENGANGVVAINLGGTAEGIDSDLLVVTGTATLDGTLEVSIVNGYVPVSGDAIDILDFDSRVCDFHTKTGLDLDGGLFLAAAFDADSMSLNVGNTPDSGQQCTAPVITSAATVNADENQTFAIDVQSTDVDGETENGGGLTYSLTGGADQALFSIDVDSGVITFNTAPDFENPGDGGSNNIYDVQVTVTDSSQLAAVQDIAVTVEDVSDSFTITWDGGGGDLDWHNALNWSTDVLPNASDDVGIAVPGDITVEINSNVSVQSVHTEESLNLNLASLTVSGESSIQGTFTDVGGTVTATGAGASLTFAGGAAIDTAHLLATAGGSLIFGPGSSYTTNPGLHRTIEANGEGSLIDFFGFTSFTGTMGTQGHTTFYTSLNAFGGGRIDLSGATSIHNQTRIQAAGEDSQGTASTVDLGSLTDFAGGGRGEIVSVSGAGVVHLPVVNSITATSLLATAGATLNLSAATSYTGGTGFHNTVQADGEGSTIDLSGVTAFVGATGVQGHTTFYTNINAYNGGLIDLSATQSVSNQTTINASGQDSQSVPSRIGLTALTRLAGGARGQKVAVADTGIVDVPILASVLHSSLSASNGATLDVSSVTSYDGGNGFTHRIQASGENSVVDLSGVTSFAGTTGSQGHTTFFTNVSAIDGGTVDLQNVTTSENQLTISSNGEDSQGQPSLVDLQSLVSLTGSSAKSISVADVGQIDLSSIAALHGTNLSATDGGLLDAATLTEYHGSSTVNNSFNSDGTGSTIDLSGLGTIEGNIGNQGHSVWHLTMQSTNNGQIHLGTGTNDVSRRVSLIAETGTISAGELKVLAGATFAAVGTLTGDLTIDSPLGIGNANGSFAGVLTVDGSYHQLSGGTLNLQLGGTVAGAEHDQLNVSGTATLDGIASITGLNGFLPSEDESFVVLTYGGVNGDFSSYLGLTLGAGLTVQTASTAKTLAAPTSGPIVVEVAGRGQLISGGPGNDDLAQIVVSLTEATNTAIESEFDAYQAHLDGGNALVPFDLTTIGVSLVGFERFDRLLEFGSFRGSYVNPIVGTNSSQTLTGTAEADLIVGNGGNDVLIGLGGNDILIAGSGNDTNDGGDGDDVYLFSGNSNGFDTFVDGLGTDMAVGVTTGTVIGINGYANGVDEFTGQSDTTIRDVNSSRTLNFSTTILTAIAEIDAAGGNDTITASNLSDGAYRGGSGNDVQNAGDANVTWLYSGTGNGFDTLNNGTGMTVAIAETIGTVIGVNGYANGVDELSGPGDTIIRDVNSSRTLDFSNTILTGIAEVDAAGGNDTITASDLSDGTYRGGSGNDSLNAGAANVIWRYSGTGNGYDVLSNGSGTAIATAETPSTIIGVNGYANGVDEFTGPGDTIIRDVNSSRTLDFSNTLLTGIAEIDAAGGNDTVTASNLRDGAYRGGSGNDVLNAGTANVNWLYTGTSNGYDAFSNGSGATIATAESTSTIIGVNGYDNGVDEFTGPGDTIIRDVSSSRTLDFSNTVLTGIAEIDAAGGNDTITASNLSIGTYRGGSGNDAQNAGSMPVTWLYAAMNNGYDTMTNGTGVTIAMAETTGIVIGVNGYTNGVDEFSGAGDTIIRDVNSSRTLNFSNTVLTGVAEIDAAGGNDTITASNLSDGTYRGGSGNDVFVVTQLIANQVAEISIADFSGTDVVDLRPLGFTNGFQDLSFSQHGSNTIVTHPSLLSLRIIDTLFEDLTSLDFLF